MKQRDLGLDLVKLLAIYFVVLGHVIMFVEKKSISQNWLCTFICSFDIPMFMMISGYFAKSSLKRELFPFIKGKFKQLILPALTCTVICCIYLFCARGQTNFRDEIIGNSWFLKTLFVFYLTFYLLKKLGLNDWLLFVVSYGLLIVTPGTTTLQISLLYPYFWIGYFLNKYNALEHGKGWIFIVSLLAFAILLFVQIRENVALYIPVTISNLQHFGHLILIRFLVALSGSLATIYGIKYFCSIVKRQTILNQFAKYGEMSLGIYVLQTILIINIFPDVENFHISNDLLQNIVVAPAISIVATMLCIWIIKIASRNKIADLLLFGGGYNKLK